jgi:hypothetical protein
MSEQEIPVGAVGALRVGVVQTATEQTIIIHGGGEPTLVTLSLLGVPARYQDGVIYIAQDDVCHAALLDIFNLICALQYMRPTFGQLIITGWDEGEVAA